MHSLVIEYLEMLPEKAVVWKSSGKAAGANTSQANTEHLVLKLGCNHALTSPNYVVCGAVRVWSCPLLLHTVTSPIAGFATSQ